MVFTKIDKVFDEKIVVDIKYSVAKAIVMLLKKRIANEDEKYHFHNAMESIENAQIWAYWHDADETKAILDAVNGYIDFVLRFRK